MLAFENILQRIKSEISQLQFITQGMECQYGDSFRRCDANSGLSINRINGTRPPKKCWIYLRKPQRKYVAANNSTWNSSLAWM